MELNYLLLLSAPILLILILVIKHLKSSSLPPGPFPWPIFGNVHQVGSSSPHTAFSRLAQTYGPLMSLKFGTQTVIVASSPTAAMEILKTQDRYLSGRYVPHAVPAKCLELNKCSPGWMVECNEQWRNLRTFCRAEIFSGKAVAGQASMRDKKVCEMLEYIDAQMKIGQVVNIRELTTAVVFNMISNILFSRDLLTLKDQNWKIIRLVRILLETMTGPNISDIFPILAPLDLQGSRKKAMELHNKTSKMWEPIINQRKEMRKSSSTATDRASTHDDFLDALIDHDYPKDQLNNMIGV